MARKPQDTCRNGHKMEDPNLIYHMRNGKRIRECRTCANQQVRARNRARLRNEILEQQLSNQRVVE